MRRLYLSLLVVLLLLFKPESLSAWDSTIAKYMPLQVGNVWVYYNVMHLAAHEPDAVSYVKYEIIGIIDTLGKKYYRLHRTTVNIAGNPICYFLPSLLRIDSSTMNICLPGSGCNGNDAVLDSLFGKKYDTSKCDLLRRVCTDTSTISVFNILLKTKKFVNDFFVEITFCRDIGIYKYSSFGANSWCVDSLRGCIINGVVYGDTSIIIGINQLSTSIPKTFELSQNYPNPFNPVTKIMFQVPKTRLPFGEGQGVGLKIYNALGHEVQILVNQSLQPGTYEVDWDASNYPSGVYFYELTSGNFMQTRKMVLIK